ncbi:hypothetical protein ABPG75_002629 [Micractinium tetrahymenae]
MMNLGMSRHTHISTGHFTLHSAAFTFRPLAALRPLRMLCSPHSSSALLCSIRTLPHHFLLPARILKHSTGLANPFAHRSASELPRQLALRGTEPLTSASQAFDQPLAYLASKMATAAARTWRTQLPVQQERQYAIKNAVKSRQEGNRRRLAVECAAPQRLEQQQQQHLRQRPPQQQAEHSRSALLRHALLSAAAAAALPALRPASAAAAALPPLQPAAAALLSGPRSSLVLAEPQLVPLQPGPIAFPRRQLGLNFAVLLMRSGYEAVDDLDCVPMDEYQKRFWKLRQAEWEPYTLLHAPLRITQGKLDDPLYFDFISFSQAASASNVFSQGQQVFEEYDEETEGMKVVRRDLALADNSLLPAGFFERQGERIYRGLVEGFRGEQYGGPPPCPPCASATELLAGVQAVLDIFAARGYALKTSITPSGGSEGRLTFTVRQEGPANLWSLQALAARRSSVYSQHDAAAVAAFLRASGRSAICRLSWTDTAVTQQWSLEA